MGSVEGVTAFTKLVEHIGKVFAGMGLEAYATCRPRPSAALPTSIWKAASVGATTVIDGVTLPLRPVAVILGKSVNNGWGAYECCWARTMSWRCWSARWRTPAARSAPRCA
jgi:phenylacetyl-CoA:acceptor oxidoreductase